MELGFGLDHGSGPGMTRIVVGPEALDALLQRGYSVQTRASVPVDLVGYQRPMEALPWLEKIATESTRRGTVDLGRSVQGQPIRAIWFGQPPESGAPSYRILSGHHGDEWSATEVALALVAELAETDGTDPLTTAVLDAATVREMATTPTLGSR